MSRPLATLLASACLAAAPAGAVTFGQFDGGNHPFVGTILFKSGGAYYSCTATALSPTLLLTAGHCTESEGLVNERTWATFAPAPSFAGIRDYPSIDAFFDDAKNGWISGTAVPHPRFDDYAEFPVTWDIGVVLLSKRVAMSAYGELPPLGFLERVRGGATARFTAVGYGQQGEIAPFYADLYARYAGTVKLDEVNSTFNGGQSAKFSNNPGIGGGTCYGDSGGPIFVEGTRTIVAVVSFGFTPCIGVDYQFRTDTPYAQDFVTPFLGKPKR